MLFLTPVLAYLLRLVTIAQTSKRTFIGKVKQSRIFPIVSCKLIFPSLIVIVQLNGIGRPDIVY